MTDKELIDALGGTFVCARCDKERWIGERSSMGECLDCDNSDKDTRKKALWAQLLAVWSNVGLLIGTF